MVSVASAARLLYGLSFSFNLVILLLLTLQNASSVLLSAYTQQRYDPAAIKNVDKSAEEKAAMRGKKFTTTHLLMAIELCKLCVALPWCAYDVYQKLVSSSIAVSSSDGDHVPRSLRAKEASQEGAAATAYADESSETRVNMASRDAAAVPRAHSGRVTLKQFFLRFAAEVSVVYMLGLCRPTASEPQGADGRRAGDAFSSSDPVADPKKEDERSGALSGSPVSSGVSFGLLASTPLRARGRQRGAWLRRQLSRVNVEALLMGVPAVVYAIQNMFVLDALSKLDPAVFQIAFQIRILITALTMKVFLKTQISSRRWGALCLLFVGVVFGQLGAAAGARAQKEAHAHSQTPARLNAALADDDEADAPKRLASAASAAASAVAAAQAALAESPSETPLPLLSGRMLSGMLSLLMGCVLSCLSAVFMEAVFKKRASKAFLSTRNVHLAFFSIMYYGLLSFNEFLTAHEAATDAATMHPQPEGSPAPSFCDGLTHFLSNYFANFDRWVWMLVLVNAIGGVLVALVMRYSDNIMKTLSTAAAIVLSGVGSYVLFETSLNMMFMTGAVLVLTAVCLYNFS